MKLTLYSSDGRKQIEITSEQFFMLRNGDCTIHDIALIANKNGVNPQILLKYADDLKRTSDEIFEVDSSCDYTDQF